MTDERRMSTEEAQKVGAALGLTGKIAWAHLKEIPDYYTRLDALEAEAAAHGATHR